MDVLTVRRGDDVGWRHPGEGLEHLVRPRHHQDALEGELPHALAGQAMGHHEREDEPQGVPGAVARHVDDLGQVVVIEAHTREELGAVGDDGGRQLGGVVVLRHGSLQVRAVDPLVLRWAHAPPPPPISASMRAVRSAPPSTR